MYDYRKGTPVQVATMGMEDQDGFLAEDWDPNSRRVLVQVTGEPAPRRIADFRLVPNVGMPVYRAGSRVRVDYNKRERTATVNGDYYGHGSVLVMLDNDPKKKEREVPASNVLAVLADDMEEEPAEEAVEA